MIISTWTAREIQGVYDNFYVDGSGNGNHLSAETLTQNPIATSDVPFGTGGNTLAADFEKTPNAEQIGTWATGPTSDKMIDSYSFTNGWTVAASFKMESWNWAVVVGKDGQPGANLDPVRGEQCVSIKVNADNHHLFCGFYDNNTNYHEMFSLEPLELDQWYSAVMTYDNNQTTVYLKKEGVDANFVGQASLPVPAGAALDLEDNFWVVGRGMWLSGTGGDIFDGLIDEVKIDDVALTPPGAIWPFEIETPAAPTTVGFRSWSAAFDLASSPYLSPPGYIFTNSHWQISSSTDFSSPEWDSGEIDPMTSATVPAGTLADGTYYGRVRYKGDSTWTEWSNTNALAFVGIETIAYWRFEDGISGVQHGGDLDNWYSDVSGNGNHMSSWNLAGRPTAINDIPFPTIVGIGENTLALDFAPGNDLGTFPEAPDTKMINSYMFTNGWTIEASFKMDVRGWRVIVGKDGRQGDLGGTVAFSAPFYIKHLDHNQHIEALCVDDTDAAHHWLQTIDPITTNTWYSIAVTFDNGSKTYSMWLKTEGDADHVLQGSVTLPESVSLGGYDRSWTIGRGMHEGNPADGWDGQIDEVRITHGARLPSEFLQELGPVPPIGDITIENLGTGNLALTWDTGLFHSYVLLEKTSLQDPTWSTNQAGIVGTETNVTVNVSTAAEDETFYAVSSEE